MGRITIFPKMKLPKMLEHPKSVFGRHFWGMELMWLDDPKKEVVQVEKEKLQRTMREEGNRQM